MKIDSHHPLAPHVLIVRKGVLLGGVSDADLVERTFRRALWEESRAAFERLGRDAANIVWEDGEFDYFLLREVPEGYEELAQHFRALPACRSHLTTVVAGFPGVGKSFMAQTRADVQDSDSSLFSWSPDLPEHPGLPRERNPAWPGNYLDHIEQHVREGRLAYVLVSTHREVLDGMKERGIPFTLAHPELALKQEYLDRFRNRFSHPGFVALLEQNYDDWIWSLVRYEGAAGLRVLRKGQFLVDVLDPPDGFVFRSRPVRGTAAFDAE